MPQQWEISTSRLSSSPLFSASSSSSSMSTCSSITSTPTARLDLQVDFPSQSARIPHSGSFGDAHCNSTPDSGNRSTGKPGSKFTKLVYALQPESLTRIMYDLDDPPARNVQQSKSLQEPTDPVPLIYVWQRLDAVLVFFIIPFAMFYYEGDQDKSVGKLEDINDFGGFSETQSRRLWRG